MSTGSRKPHHLLLEALDAVGMSVWLSRGRSGGFEIRAWSDGAEKLYGIRRQDALGTSYLDLFVNPLERDQSEADCERILDGEVFHNFMAEDIDANGNPRKILTNCVRVWDDELDEWLQAEIGTEISDLGDDSEEALRRIREVALKQQDAARRMLLIDNMKTITTAITSVSGEPDGIERVLHAIAGSVDDVTRASAATSVWRTGAGETLDQHSRAGWDGVQIPMETERKAAMWVRERRRSMFVDSTTRRRDLPRAIAAMTKPLRTAALALLPMMFAERAVGVIVIVVPAAPAGHELVRWSAELREALDVFAQHAAIAVVNAGQIGDLRRLSEVIAENQERETRDKLTDDFVHQVRHVATPIVAFAQLLKEDIAALDPATRDRLLPRVDMIETRATDFLERVREIASGLEASEFDVSDLIEGKLRELKATHALLRTEYRDNTTSPALVRWIRPFVFSALENVLVNAVAAMQGAGRLGVTMDDSNAMILIRVIDEGPGIASADIDRVWDKGFSTRGEGHGYGLWRTRDIIESMRGQISIAATGPNGTTFEIALPRSDSQSPSS